MDIGVILTILVGFAIALAVVSGGLAARLLMRAAERTARPGTGHDR
jgi:hypothetical protein